MRFNDSGISWSIFSCVQQTCALEHQLNAVASILSYLMPLNGSLVVQGCVKNQDRFLSTFRRPSRHVVGWPHGGVPDVQAPSRDGEDATKDPSPHGRYSTISAGYLEHVAESWHGGASALPGTLSHDQCTGSHASG